MTGAARSDELKGGGKVLFIFLMCICTEPLFPFDRAPRSPTDPSVDRSIIVLLTYLVFRLLALFTLLFCGPGSAAGHKAAHSLSDLSTTLFFQYGDVFLHLS